MGAVSKCNVTLIPNMVSHHYTVQYNELRTTRKQSAAKSSIWSTAIKVHSPYLNVLIEPHIYPAEVVQKLPRSEKDEFWLIASRHAPLSNRAQGSMHARSSTLLSKNAIFAFCSSPSDMPQMMPRHTVTPKMYYGIYEEPLTVICQI